MDRTVDMVLKVEYREPKDLLSDYLTSLGDGGMFINTNFPFNVGDRIACSISFPGLLDPRELVAIVRWRREADPEKPEEPPGLGVEFVFANEAERQELHEFIDSLRAGVPQGTPKRSGPFRVLLVEDNDFIQDLFAYAVRCFHYEHIKQGVPEILRASDGQEALRVLSGTTVDLAIVDHFLPLMTGCELIRRIRQAEDRKDLPILVVSVGGDQIKKEALESGADLFLDKPVLNKQLVQTISTLLGRSEP